MIAEAYLRKREEAGRRKVDAEWRPWYERLQAAKQRGEPFDEPPPFMRVGQDAASTSDVHAALNSRIDRVFFAILGIGAAQIALLITLILRS